MYAIESMNIINSNSVIFLRCKVLSKSQKHVLLLEMNTKLNVQCLHTIPKCDLLSLKLFESN